MDWSLLWVDWDAVGLGWVWVGMCLSCMGFHFV